MRRETNLYYDKYKRNKKSQKFYRSKEWSKARELTLKRDQYLCQNCLSKKILKPAEVVHHIKELVDYPSLATELSNLISWCHACHSSHHKIGNLKKKDEIKVSEKIEVISNNNNKEKW